MQEKSAKCARPETAWFLKLFWQAWLCCKATSFAMSLMAGFKPRELPYHGGVLSNQATHLLKGFIFFFFSYYIQHCFICRPSDSTVPTDAGIEARTVALAGPLHWQSDVLTTRLDLIRISHSQAAYRKLLKECRCRHWHSDDWWFSFEILTNFFIHG